MVVKECFRTGTYINLWLSQPFSGQGLCYRRENNAMHSLLEGLRNTLRSSLTNSRFKTTTLD